MSSIPTLSSNFKPGDLILNFLNPPNKNQHSFAMTCLLSSSYFGSKLEAFNFMTVAKNMASCFLMPTTSQFAKGTSFCAFSSYGSFCMVALQEQKRTNNKFIYIVQNDSTTFISKFIHQVSV